MLLKNGLLLSLATVLSLLSATAMAETPEQKGLRIAKEADAKGLAVCTVRREKLWLIQTPQVFPFKVIKEAYDRAYRDRVYATDDAALVERLNGKIKIIEGSPFNIKITTPEDLEIVKSLMPVHGSLE